jgi:hypothetical protein
MMIFKLEQLLAANKRVRDEEGAAPPKRGKSIGIAEELLYRL